MRKPCSYVKNVSVMVVPDVTLSICTLMRVESQPGAMVNLRGGGHAEALENTSAIDGTI